MFKKGILSFFLILQSFVFAQEVAILKYGGGGDWYSNPTAVPNLIAFANKNAKTTIDKNPKTVAVNNQDLFNFPTTPQISA